MVNSKIAARLILRQNSVYWCSRYRQMPCACGERWSRNLCRGEKWQILFSVMADLPFWPQTTLSALILPSSGSSTLSLPALLSLLPFKGYKAIIVNDNHQARSDWPQRKDWVGHSPTSELTVHIALDLCFETCIWAHSDQSPFPQVFSRGKPKGGNLLIFWSLNIIELGSDLWVLVSLTYSLS